MMIFRFEIKPLAKPRMTRADAWRKRPCVLKYWAYKDELVKLAKAQKYVPHPDDALFFSLPMPSSWSLKKSDAKLADYHTQKPDLDNLIKGFWDALLDDDSGLHKVVAFKMWGIVGQIIVVRPNEILKKEAV